MRPTSKALTELSHLKQPTGTTCPQLRVHNNQSFSHRYLRTQWKLPIQNVCYTWRYIRALHVCSLYHPKICMHIQISAIESKRQLMSITYKPWTILNSFTPFEKGTSDNKTTTTRQKVQVTLIKPSVSPDNSQVYSQQKLSDQRRSSRDFCCSMYLVTDVNIHSFSNTCIIQRWECSSHVRKTSKNHVII